MSQPSKTAGWSRRGRGAARAARIRIRAASLLALAIVAGCGLLFALKRVRDRQIAVSALAAAREAAGQRDWERAVFEYRRSLDKDIQNTEALREFSRAVLQLRPLERAALGGAHDALVRVFDAGGASDADLEQIRELRLALKLNDDIVAQCRRAIAQNADDIDAIVWLARAQAAAGYQPRARETLGPLLDRFEEQRDLAAKNRKAFARAFELIAQLLVTASTQDSAQAAIRQLDRGSEILPNCGEIALARAKLRRARAGTFGNAAATDLELAKLDLTQAESGTFTDPLALLDLAAEWIESSEPVRAEAALRRADEVPAEQIALRGFDADDWRVGRYLCEAELALRRGAAERARDATDEIVATIKTKRQRLRILPTAARVYLALSLVDALRPVVADFSSVQAALHAGREDQAAFLEAQLAQLEDRPESVVRLLEPVVARDADLMDAWRLLATAYDKLDNPAAAARALSRILAEDPHDLEAGARLVRAHMRRGDWQSAVDAAHVLESLRPSEDHLRALRMSAELANAVDRGEAIDRNWIESQRRELARLRDKAPRKTELIVLSARLAAAAGEVDAADRLFAEAETAGDEAVEARLARTFFLIDNRRFSQAVEIARANTTAAPRNIATWQALGDACLASGDLDGAIRSLDDGSERAVSPRARALLISRAAQLELSANRRGQALARLTAQSARDASDARCRSLLLAMPEFQQQEAIARRTLDELCGLSGADAPLCKLHRAALLLNKDTWRQQRAEIERLLRESIAGNPDWTAPVLLMGQMQEQLNLIPAAEETYRAALGRNPGGADVADRLLRLLDATGRLSEAPAILNRLTLRPRVANAFRLAAAFAEGAFDQAIAEAEARVASDPGDAQARVLLARLLYMARRDAAAALAQLDAAQRLLPEGLAARFLRVSILRGEKRESDALDFLNAEVGKNNSVEALLLRAQFLAFIGDRAAAERDYRKLTEVLPGGSGFELLGAFLLEGERRGEALAAWTEGLTRFADRRELKRRLMKALLLGDENEQKLGLRCLGELESSTPRDPELMRVRAFALRSQGGAEAMRKAAELLEQAIAMEPGAVDAHRALISLAFERGDFAAARVLSLRAIGSAPNDPSIAAYRAMAELALGNAGLGRALSIGILLRDARHVDAAIVLLQSSLALGDPDGLSEAERVTQTARVENPWNEALNLTTARVFRVLGKQREAADLLTDLLAARPDAKGARSELMQALMGEERLVEAACVWAEGIERDPENNRLASVRAMLDARQGRLDAAFSRLARHASDSPEYRSLRLTTAALLCNSSDAAESELGISLLLDATRWDDAIDALTGLADGLVRSGRMELAAGAYREILANEPRNSRALNDLAWLHARQADYPAALDYADRGLRVDPSDDTLLDTRGTILAAMPQRLRDARADFERAGVLRRFRPQALAGTLMRLGEVCLRMEDAACARRALDEIRRLQENHHVLNAEQLREFEALGARVGRLSSDSRAVATLEIER